MMLERQDLDPDKLDKEGEVTENELANIPFRYEEDVKKYKEKNPREFPDLNDQSVQKKEDDEEW